MMWVSMVCVGGRKEGRGEARERSDLVWVVVVVSVLVLKTVRQQTQSELLIRQD